MSVFEKIDKLASANARIRTALADKGIDVTNHGAEDFAADVNSIPKFDPDDYAFVIYKENDEYKRRYVYIGKSVTTLGYNVFRYDANIISVVLPLTVTTLGQYCFEDCSKLESITTENVTTLSLRCFDGCVNLRELNCPNVNSSDSNIFNQGYETPFLLKRILLPKLQYITNGMFRNLNSKGFPELEYADIRSATVISNSAFKDDWSLSNVEFGDVATISGYAFGNTSLAGELNFPNLLSIEYGAFENTKITKVKNLGSITYLYNAFGGCSKLTFIRIPSTVVTLDNTVVYGTYDSSVTVVCMPDVPPEYKWNSLSGASVVYVPDTSVDTYKAASGWSAIASKIHPLSEYTGSD